MNIAREQDGTRDTRQQPAIAALRGVSPERLDLIRERIREGAYESAAVREATARGILGKGEIERIR